MATNVLFLSTILQYLYLRPMIQYGEMGCEESCGKLASDETCGDMMEIMPECSKSTVMQNGETSNYDVDVLQRVSQGCTLSFNLFKVHIIDMMVAVEAAKGVTVGKDAVLGLMFADDFVDIRNTRRIAETVYGRH